MAQLTAIVLTDDKFFLDSVSYFLGQRGYLVQGRPAAEAAATPPPADLYLVHGHLAGAAGLWQHAPASCLVVYDAGGPLAEYQRLSRLGAQGCLTTTDGLTELLLCLEHLARGERYASPAAQCLLRQPTAAPATTGATPAAGAAPAELPRLSNQERNILTLIGQGMGSKQIADKLFVSAHTIKNHKANITRKLAIGSCRELLSVALALR